MGVKTNNILLFLFIIILISFTVITWNYIKIPFSGNEIIGQYSINKHHSLNDPLRYLLFVIIPLVGFLLHKKFIEKKKLIFHL